MVGLALLCMVVFLLSSDAGGLAQHGDGAPPQAPLSKALHLTDIPPNSADFALIKPSPQIDPQALVARGSVATCGYVSGNSGA